MLNFRAVSEKLAKNLSGYFSTHPVQRLLLLTVLRPMLLLHILKKIIVHTTSFTSYCYVRVERWLEMQLCEGVCFGEEEEENVISGKRGG